MDSNKLFDFDYEVNAPSNLFYLNQVIKDEDGNIIAEPILKDEDYKRMLVKNRITVLNKAECGNGGTSGIVEYIKRSNTGCLILVPNVSICVGKEDKYKDDPDICCVYGGVDKIDYNAQIVIATYDQFKRLLANLKDFGASADMFSNNFWADRAIFVDEYHKLVDESDFRDVMASLTELIINTDLPVTLMSATPHYGYIDALRSVVHKETVSINIVYSRRMVKAMSVYEMSQSKLEGFFKHLINKNQQICVFINNVAKVARALNAIGTDDCEILCSAKNEKNCGDYYSSKFNPKKKVHFMTSAYFTGHDIDYTVDSCIIIGGRSTSAMALSMRDIKQIIGRFREHCGWSWDGIYIMYLKEMKNDIAYDNVEKQLKHTIEMLELCGDNWAKKSAGIKTKLDNLHFTDLMKSLDYWSTPEKLIKTLKANGYEVYTKVENGKQTGKAKPIGELPDYEVEPSLTFRQAYTKISNGEDVSWKDYRDVNKIKRYIDKYGVSAKIPTREQVFDMVDINDTVENSRVPIDELSIDERYTAFGFKDCKIYKASYLMNCLKYIKANYPEMLLDKLDYGLLPVHMKQLFGCIMFCYKAGNKSSSDHWCVIGYNIINQLQSVSNILFTDFSGSGIYIEQLPQNNKKGISPTIKLSYRSDIRDGHCYARTTVWDELHLFMNPLKGIPVYDWVNEDKAVRLYQIKMEISELDKWTEMVKSGKQLSEVKEKIFKEISSKKPAALKVWAKAMEDKAVKWKSMKNFKQLQISEFYRNTDNEYRQIKAEMNEIACLIIDIDDSISFSQFKKMYGNWMWCAYPTISNTDPNDWNKFRVVVPLKHPVKITGDNNQKVLKALRSMFCAYEDKAHNMGSYINPHDFSNKYINDGEQMFNIEQSDVDLLQHAIKIAKDNTKMKFGEDKIEKVVAVGNRCWWSLDRAIKYYEQHDKDNERHPALFKIKNSLSEGGCDRFAEWLMANHPSKVHHWKSHKRLVSGY